MKYAVFKNNQFIKVTDEIIPNTEYMYYEIDLSDIANELENNLRLKYTSILQRIRFLFTGKL